MFTTTNATGKYGPFKITLHNPSAAQATLLFVTALIVSGGLVLLALFFFVQNILAIIAGAEPLWWHVMWAALTGMYLVSVAASD